MPPLKVGELAPEFDVPAALGTNRSRVRLSEFRGKQNVVLAFYVLNWTPT